jgi:Tfp pilus assembly protein PilN
MIERDFLPDWHMLRLDRRRSAYAFVWLGACLVGVMAAWFCFVQGQVARRQVELGGLQTQRGVVTEQLARWDKLLANRDTVMRKAAVVDRLSNSPDAIHVLGRMADLIPADIVLISLDLGTEAEQTPFVPAAGQAGAGKDKAGQGKNAAPAQPRSHYTFRVDGLAPNDEVIASFVTGLTNSDGFTNVQVNFTRDQKRAGRVMRQFEMTCQAADEWERTDSVPTTQRADGLLKNAAGRSMGVSPMWGTAGFLSLPDTGKMPVPPVQRADAERATLGTVASHSLNQEGRP